MLNFPDDYTNRIICGDSLDLMKQIPAESVDLIVTSPPYNIRNTTGGGGMDKGSSGKWRNCALAEGYDGYDDCMPMDEYNKWQHECLSEMFRIIKPNGAIFYNHKWRVQNGLLQDRSEIVKDLPVRQIIIWHRKGGINFNKRFFLPTYEVVYFIPKKEFELAPKANAYGDVWDITQELNNPHPAPFPEELSDRIISSTSAQLVLDPFCGSGTTAVSAKKLGRYYIGIDRSEKYCEMARNRINSF